MAITQEVLFIGPEYAKKMSTINDSVEDSYMNTLILLAQDKHVHKYLGTRLFQKIKDDVRNDSISGNYESLLDKHIRKVTLWWMMIEMIPHLHVKIHNGGLVLRTAENAITISKEDLNRELDIARQNAHMYTNLMITYLCNNTDLFPEYLQHEPGDIYPEQNVVAGTAGFIVGSGSHRDNRDRYSWMKR